MISLTAMLEAVSNIVWHFQHTVLKSKNVHVSILYEACIVPG